MCALTSSARTDSREEDYGQLGIAPLFTSKEFSSQKIPLTLRMRNTWTLISYLGRPSLLSRFVLLLIFWSSCPQGMNSNCSHWGCIYLLPQSELSRKLLLKFMDPWTPPPEILILLVQYGAQELLHFHWSYPGDSDAQPDLGMASPEGTGLNGERQTKLNQSPRCTLDF